MKMVFSQEYERHKHEIVDFIEHFEKGKLLGKGIRNQIRLFDLGDRTINIKSFKEPNFFNKLAYRYFRKSKAQRSFDYAHLLLKKGIGTPFPIGYIECYSSWSFKNSYYISEHLPVQYTLREVILQSASSKRDAILKQFTGFTFDLHENQVEFLDHSPGNTLIKNPGAEMEFYLVDLNRMNFGELAFDQRMKNFSRLTSKREIVALMASEYADLAGYPEKQVFQKMWGYTQRFQRKFKRKKKLKKKIKFWKS